MKKLATKFLVTLLLSLLLCAACFTAAANQAPSTSYKVIPIQQWETLKQTQQSLELELYELSVQVEKLEKPSKELLAELTEAKVELRKSQAALLKSNEELQSAKDSLDKVQKLSTELTHRISAERDKQEAIRRRMKFQQGIWFLLGVVVGGKVF